MRFSILFALFSLVPFFSHSQNEIRENKGLFGIYNYKTKKWVLPAAFNSLNYIATTNSTYSNYILAENKIGKTILDANSFKAIVPVSENIEIVNIDKQVVLIREKNREYFFNLLSGPIVDIGEFDSHKKSGFNYDGLILKKGSENAFFKISKIQRTEFFDGDIVEEINETNYVIRKNQKHGINNAKGDELIPLVYDTIVTNYSNICSFSLTVKLNDKWGIINELNKPIIPINYEKIDLAIFKYFNRFSDSCIYIYPVKKNGKWGIIGTEEKIMIPFTYDSIVSVVNNSNLIVIKNGKRGLIDFKNNILFPFDYKYFEYVNDFSREPKNKKYYLVNNSCTLCNPLKLEAGWGIADSTGKLVQEMNGSLIPLTNYGKQEYENFDSSNYGFLWNVGGKKVKSLLKVEEYQNEYVDDMGNFSMISVFDSIFSYYFIGGKTGVVNSNGKIIIPINNDDLILSLYKFSGSEPFDAHDIRSLSEKNFAYKESYLINNNKNIFLKQNNKWGVILHSGIQIIPCLFDSIQDIYFDRYDICEVSDSIQNTLNYPLEQYKCFLNNNLYFYTKSGEFLNKRLQQEQSIGELNFVLNPPNKGNYYFTPIYDLIAINPKPEFHCLITEIETEEMNANGDWTVVNKKQTNNFYTPTANRFNFFNPLTSKYLFPELIEDFFMLANWSDRGLLALQWSVTKDRIKIASHNINYYDNNTIEKIDPSKAINFNPLDIYQRFGRYDSTIFVKQNNKWFIRNLNEPNFKNKVGFDSVFVNSNHSFIAYNNGSFATYDFNEINFDKTKINFVFPDYGNYKLACSSCEYTYIDKKTKIPQFSFDAEGNEIQGDTIISITKIPLVTKGKLNITNNYAVPILEKWVDEIIFPKSYSAYYSTNLNDKNDHLLNQEFIYDFELSNITNVKTIAYRIDKNWYLITLDESKTIQGPFDTIKNEGISWITTKAGETKSFSTRDLGE